MMRNARKGAFMLYEDNIRNEVKKKRRVKFNAELN